MSETKKRPARAPKKAKQPTPAEGDSQAKPDDGNAGHEAAPREVPARRAPARASSTPAKAAAGRYRVAGTVDDHAASGCSSTPAPEAPGVVFCPGCVKHWTDAAPST